MRVKREKFSEKVDLVVDVMEGKCEKVKVANRKGRGCYVVHENKGKKKEENAWRKWCEACGMLHSLSDFTEGEVGKAAQHRRCKGRTARLDVCQHWSTDWDELREHLPEPGDKMYCEGGHHGNIPPVSEDPRDELTLIRDSSNEVILRKKLVLAHCPSFAKHYPPLLLQRRLEQLQQPLCPHMYMDIYGYQTHLDTRGCKSQRSCGRLCECCGGVHKCPDPRCETEWWVSRRKEERHDSVTDLGSERADEMVLEVERRLGKMSDEWGVDGVVGERWCVQIVGG